MTERTSGERHPRSWTDEEIEAIAAADTEFPTISEDDLARALAQPRRVRAPMRAEQIADSRVPERS
ncbi:MAG: hypothetical protein ICV87_05920 [Gemmatimonadetes bacterium]|nr:hypothetical protein [Gemmatimonadota bacterium]